MALFSTLSMSGGKSVFPSDADGGEFEEVPAGLDGHPVELSEFIRSAYAVIEHVFFHSAQSVLCVLSGEYVVEDVLVGEVEHVVRGVEVDAHVFQRLLGLFEVVDGYVYVEPGCFGSLLLSPLSCIGG